MKRAAPGEEGKDAAKGRGPPRSVDETRDDWMETMPEALKKQEAMACDDTLSTVKQSRAKAQVAILKNVNGQSLRTMRITQAAAARKMAKAAAKMKEAASKACLLYTSPSPRD